MEFDFPIWQIGHVSYHDYCGILIDEEEKQSLKNDLGPNNLVRYTYLDFSHRKTVDSFNAYDKWSIFEVVFQFYRLSHDQLTQDDHAYQR